MSEPRSRASDEGDRISTGRTSDYLRQAGVANIESLRQKREAHIRESLPMWKDIAASSVSRALAGKDSARVRKLWWQGIPPSLRGRIWIQALPNTLNITHELFEILVKQAEGIRSAIEIQSAASSASSSSSKTTSAAAAEQSAPAAASSTSSSRASSVVTTDSVSVSSSVSPSLSQEDEYKGPRILGKMGSAKLIRFDVPRTFKLLQFFQEGGPFHESLRQVLEAYVCYRPDLGYVQGMTFLVAPLLLNMEAPDAFVMLCNILNMPFERYFYSLNMEKIGCYTSLINRLLKEYLPRLYKHLQVNQIAPDMFALDWVMTLFSKSLPLDVAMHIWDIFMLEGEWFVFRTVIGLLRLIQNELLQSSMERCLQLLMNIPGEIVTEALLENISAIPLTEKKFVDMLNKECAPGAPPIVSVSPSHQ